MKRRELDGCPITGALQMLGDKWTMLVVRELLGGPKRTMELLNSLSPDQQSHTCRTFARHGKGSTVERTDFGGNPPHIEYELTQRGMLLLPLLESLRQLGLALKCNDREDRKKRIGAYCEPCPLNETPIEIPTRTFPIRREKDDSIVLL